MISDAAIDRAMNTARHLAQTQTSLRLLEQDVQGKLKELNDTLRMDAANGLTGSCGYAETMGEAMACASILDLIGTTMRELGLRDM